MRTLKTVLSGKGLLAASIAVIAGPALAETAGKVSFVTGDVSVSAADGSTRKLVRGDAINGGDRITTRSGRLQIRFTDGGFVSLQPNSVFAVDEYLYANRKPEESSLFFSLIQGGMRTITGAIGKVNKKSYQVRTPVATIGIRGTEYLATVDEAGLIVSVGSGLVNVANNRGEVTAGAGQNIRVLREGEPVLARKEAELRARGPKEEPEEDYQEERGDDDTVAVGDVIDGEGGYVFLQKAATSLPDSNPFTGRPRYSLDSPLLIGSYRGYHFSANFDQTGAVTGQPGAIQNLYYTGDGTFSFFRTENLSVVNVKTVDALTWGEFTLGDTTTNSLFDTCNDGCTGPFTLEQGSYVPYIAGDPSFTNYGKGTATYTLQGGTAPRNLATGQAGRLDGFRIRVNLDFATIEAALKVTMPGDAATETPSNTYLVRTLSPVALLNLGTQQTFALNDSQLTVSDSSGGCASSTGGCAANITGFFAGNLASQIGASYRIDDFTSSASIGGVAALGLSSYDSSTALEDGPGYSAAYAIPYLTSVIGGTTGYEVSSGLDYVTGLTATFDADNLLVSAYGPGGNPALVRSGSTVADDRGKAGALTWGRWFVSSTDSILVEGNPFAPGTGTYLHYITGPMTHYGTFDAITSVYGSGATATYTYQGGTTATGTDGSTGKVLSGSHLLVTFSALPTLALDLRIGMDDAIDYRLTGSGIGITVDGTTAKFSSGSVGCSTSASGSTSGCTGSVSGFFAGQQAKQVGMSYEVFDYGINRHVNGAAAFGRGSINRASTPIVVTEPIF